LTEVDLDFRTANSARGSIGAATTRESRDERTRKEVVKRMIADLQIKVEC
jgi:hypothetical protein